MKVKEFIKDEKIFKSENLIDSPKISIILPTYCRGDSGLLERAINSVINQTFKEWELIIVDDGSVDSTRNIVENYMKNDNRIVYIRNDINSGIPAIRVNQGVKRARGKYIAYQFDDDRWHDYALEVLYNKIITLDDLAFVYGKCKGIDLTRNGEIIYIGIEFNEQLINQFNFIANNSVLHSKELLYLYGGYDCHIAMRRLCDWDLWRRLSKKVKMNFIDEEISIVEAGNKDAVGVIYNLNRDVVDERVLIDRSDILSLNNIEEYELDNADITQNINIANRLLNKDILLWHKKINKI